MNKNLVKKIIFSVVLATVFFQANAQTNDLTSGEIEEFKERTKKIIDRFQEMLSILGSKDETYQTKQVWKKQVLKLFIGGGKPYKDTYGNMKRAVHMQVSSLKGGVERRYNVNLIRYLDRLIMSKYKKINITKAETFRISSIFKVGDHYEANVTIYQKFEAYGWDNNLRYSDLTKKTIRIYIIPQDDYYGRRWFILLGDVDVAETSKI